MNQNDLSGLIALVVVTIGGGASLCALLTVCELLLPRLTGRARATAEQMPRRSIAVGLVNAIFFGVLIAALGAGDDGARILSLLILAAMLGLAAIGLAGIAQRVGDRLAPGRGPHTRLASGAALLILASLTPIVGWLALAPLTLLAGLGAAIIAIIQRGGARQPAPPIVEEAQP
jgi:hypothetical protein